MNWISVLFWAIVGGIFLELLHWYRLRTNPKFPSYIRMKKYWILTGLMIGFGGLIAVLFLISGSKMTPLNAFVLGFSTPALPHELGKFLPKTVVAGKTTEDEHVESIRDFLTS